MQLFLIRHAAAAPRSPRGIDAERRLTAPGRKRWQRAVRGLEALGVRFDVVHHSPWRRAVETAELIPARMAAQVRVAPELARRPTPRLLEPLDGERIALVGHQPWLGELAGLLLWGDAGMGEQLAFKKGGVLWLEGEPRPGGMSLVALLPPRVLRKLGA